MEKEILKLMTIIELEAKIKQCEKEPIRKVAMLILLKKLKEGKNEKEL